MTVFCVLTLPPYTLILLTLMLFTGYIPTEAYTLKPSESILDGQTLISQGGNFQLGFFTPSTTSKKRYLGIWYRKLQVQTVVWVANRDAPIYDTSGVLMISSKGNLVILENKTDTVIWSSNSSNSVENPIVELLESGNLVLRDLKNSDTKSYIWQSFDYPGDTLLPGMKLGWNLRTKTNRYLSSWKNDDDPSPGEYTWRMVLDGYPEFILRHGSTNYYRDGPWNGLQGIGSPDLRPFPGFTYEFVNNADEIYYTYKKDNHSTIQRMVLTQTSSGALLKLLTLTDKNNNWITQMMIPRDRCDRYALCGAYSTCDVGNIEVCQCLKGFEPKSPEDWKQFNWSQGCKRQVPIKCTKGEGFKRYIGVKLPETAENCWVNASMNRKECRVMCMNNCSCMAYSNLYITEGVSGCMLWFTDLIDMRNLKGVRQNLYIRMSASELVSSSRLEMKKHLIVSVMLVFGVGTLGLGSWWLLWKRRSLRGLAKRGGAELPLFSKRDSPELSLFDLGTIRRATNNFSEENKLGQGGFGTVYKGTLDQEEIAVKRLSKNSIQGIDELKNEVILISKIQHRNLVRILGCCIQGDEMMLIYEYMHNNSLDSYIFDAKRSQLLNWQKRSHIISGISRGLLYLHHDSRIRIIHRDLKASNILLDNEMVAKISDFGIARIFGEDQNEGRTKIVIGTRGYMSPEYMEGHFSVKSDVFSFGVLVLEIISGKKNSGFSHPDQETNLLGTAWKLWKADRSIELVDESMEISGFDNDISRCIHIGLLCVQKGVNERPTMSSVVLMLSSETSILPEPQPPGFYIEMGHLIQQNSSNSNKGTGTANDATITLLEAR